MLDEHNITLVVDVRSKTGSRVSHFDEARFGRLSALLRGHGIAYDDRLHLTLGGLQHGKMTLGNFRAYTLTLAYLAAIDDLAALVDANRTGNTAILCCERDPRACHRSAIAETFARRRWRITHIV